MATRQVRRGTVDLSTYVPNVPEGTIAALEVRGSVDAFVIEVERDYRWTLEGTLDSAELTGVFGDDGMAEKPERVPGWIECLLGEFGIEEVSV